MLVLAEERAELDCEDQPWEPQAISDFAVEAEREPRSQYDLHLLALSRLDDLLKKEMKVKPASSSA
jgi:hypothetical protein